MLSPAITQTCSPMAETNMRSRKMLSAIRQNCARSAPSSGGRHGQHLQIAQAPMSATPKTGPTNRWSAISQRAAQSSGAWLALSFYSRAWEQWCGTSPLKNAALRMSSFPPRTHFSVLSRLRRSVPRLSTSSSSPHSGSYKSLSGPLLPTTGSKDQASTEFLWIIGCPTA